MNLTNSARAAVLSFLALGACDAAGPVSGTAAGSVVISVAPLTLPDIGRACYDLRVSNGGASTVWARGNPALTLLGADQNGGPTSGAPDTDAVCSSAFGSGAGGDISFVGTCDATTDSDVGLPGVQNAVTIWVDGLYDAAGTADLGDWRDPCPSGCTVMADCAANTDAAVTFDLTLLREARQGFFDVAVTFDDVFCSGKLDSCSPDGPDAGTEDDPTRLLFGADGVRDWTAVFGFACTAGPGVTATELHYGQVAITCGGTKFVVDPTLGPGELSTDAGGDTLHYGVFRGTEQLSCGAASCQKAYWNLAFSLDDLAALGGDCALAFEATATAAGTPFIEGLPTAGHQSYPYIAVAAPLTSGGTPLCQGHGLDDLTSPITTAYRGTLGGTTPPVAMCSTFDGATAAPTEAAACATTLALTISANVSGYDVRAAAGVPETPLDITVTIEPGVVVSSASTFAAAFRTGNLPAGSTVTLVNHGYILGAGGAGSVGTQCSNGVPGGAGGAAIDTRVPLTIDNTDGNVWGGGGGGSGSAGDCAGGHYGGSGGGGAGGGAGAQSTSGFASNAGTTGPTGVGGTGSDGSWGGTLGYNTRGGSGGSYGFAGGQGSNYSGSWGNQPGGAAGLAVKTNGNSVAFSAGGTSPRVKGAIQ